MLSFSFKIQSTIQINLTRLRIDAEIRSGVICLFVDDVEFDFFIDSAVSIDRGNDEAIDGRSVLDAQAVGCRTGGQTKYQPVNQSRKRQGYTTWAEMVRQ